MDRDDLSHLVEQAVHDMDSIGDASAEGANGMDQLFAEDFSVDGAAVFLVSVCICFLHGYGCITALSHRQLITGKEWT